MVQAHLAGTAQGCQARIGWPGSLRDRGMSDIPEVLASARFVMEHACSVSIDERAMRSWAVDNRVPHEWASAGAA